LGVPTTDSEAVASDNDGYASSGLSIDLTPKHPQAAADLAPRAVHRAVDPNERAVPHPQAQKCADEVATPV
jgi:hypothetical protein